MKKRILIIILCVWCILFVTRGCSWRTVREPDNTLSDVLPAPESRIAISEKQIFEIDQTVSCNGLSYIVSQVQITDRVEKTVWPIVK